MLSRQWLFLMIRLMLVLILVGSALACNKVPDEDCNECTLGDRKCSAGGDGILICKKMAATGCQKMVLERCLSGQTCGNSSGRSECEIAGSACVGAPTCTESQQRCEGENVAVCRREPSSGCMQWFVEKTCLPDQPCNATTGDCGSGNAGCQPKNPQQEKRCVGNAVHWFDDCGQQGQLIEACDAGKTCQAGTCTGGSSCQPQNLQKEKKCVGNDIYWFDDCGQQRDWISKCASGQTCQNAQCVGGGCQPQNPQHEKRCVGISIHWFDDCGQQGAKIQECVAPQTCQNGNCQSNCNNQCSGGQSQCVGNSLQTCDRDPATGCYSWGQAFPCPASQVCQGGICVADPNGNGNNGGPQQCKVGAAGTCKSDSECCPGQTCKNLIIKGCGPCSSSSDCPTNGLFKLSCCTIPIVNASICALICP